MPICIVNLLEKGTVSNISQIYNKNNLGHVCSTSILKKKKSLKMSASENEDSSHFTEEKLKYKR